MGRLIKMWPIVIAVITLVFAVGTTTSTIQKIEQGLEKNDIRDEDQEKRIVRTEESIENIDNRLDRMEDKIDKILRLVK